MAKVSCGCGRKFLGLLITFSFLNVGIAQTQTKAKTATAPSVVDEELLQSLKIEANHDLNRLKSLKSEKSNQKIYDNEREKGLGSFLEEQEKWDLSRERGLAEYRKQKKQTSPQEGGPEYLADQKEKKREADKMEQSRRMQVRTKTQVFSANKNLINKLESEELGLNQNRPRYSLRKRGQNRWVKNPSAAPRAGSTSNYIPPPPVSNFDDFPPPPAVTEYPGSTMPMDNYEEIPPPPPPVYEGYGNATGFDSGFGDIPPPPPPPPIFDDF